MTTNTAITPNHRIDENCVNIVVINGYPDSKVHGVNMGPTWVLSASDGPHVGPMNLATRVGFFAWAGLMFAQSQAKIYIYLPLERNKRWQLHWPDCPELPQMTIGQRYLWAEVARQICILKIRATNENSGNKRFPVSNSCSLGALYFERYSANAKWLSCWINFLFMMSMISSRLYSFWSYDQLDIGPWAPSQYKDRLIYVWRFPC